MLFYELIQVAFDLRERLSRTPTEKEWAVLFEMSNEQSVAGVTFMALDKLMRFGQKPPLNALYEWIAVSQHLRATYAQSENAVEALSKVLYEGGFKMMILKGHGIALNYPIKELRPSGDLDIWCLGREKEVDNYLSSKAIKIDNSHHHHSVFHFEGVIVENHYDFINVHSRPSNKVIEVYLKKLAQEGIIKAQNNDCVYYPSADFNALFLLVHSASHFICNEMVVRHLIDWGLFFKYHHEEITWDNYLFFIKEIGLNRFYNLLGLFCMRNFGFDASIFNGINDDEIFNRFNDDILYPEFNEKENGYLINSMWVKSRRWWHNRWKNQLCYPDSLFSTFLYSFWGKILKPSHFIH